MNIETAIMTIAMFALGVTLGFAFPLHRRQKPAPKPPTFDEQLQARADWNRDHADQFDALFYNVAEKRWCERGTGYPVVFTPYGWRVEKEVAAEIAAHEERKKA